MHFRKASAADVALLAEFNRQLIQDEGHRNRMTLPELEDRMRTWLLDIYEAIIFEDGTIPVAYALYRQDGEAIYLRQFFVERQHRRAGVGRQALRLLLREIWPHGWRVTTDVLVGNGRAYSFWKAIGFQDYAMTLEMVTSDENTYAGNDSTNG